MSSRRESSKRNRSRSRSPERRDKVPRVDDDRDSRRRSRHEDKPDNRERIRDHVQSKAAEISKQLQSKSVENTNVDRKHDALKSSVDAQLASVAAVMRNVNYSLLRNSKKAANHALRLDEQGREVDEFNNVIQQASLVKTLAANVQAEKTAKKKKENPYLAHRGASSDMVRR